MSVLILVAVIVAMATMLFIIVDQRRTISELLDRIMTLQALPPVSSPLKQAQEMLKGSAKEDKQVPRERPVKERITFRNPQPL